MSLSPVVSKQFKKDIKKIKGQGKDISIIRNIMEKLIDEILLDKGYRDHSLQGKYKNHRECHIKPDWLLIYKTTKDEIFFERTGSHSELFK